MASIAALTSLGVLGAVGAYYVPGILDRLGAEATDRVPVDFDLVLDGSGSAVWRRRLGGRISMGPPTWRRDRRRTGRPPDPLGSGRIRGTH
jgi:hypothetical protein